MSRYTVIIMWSEEDGCYITSVPDLPGCVADGETKEEALMNTETIIQEWIETAKELGRDIPQPSNFSVPIA